MFIDKSFIGRVGEYGDESFSLAIFAFSTEIGESVLFFHFNFLGEGDSNLFGEELVAWGAFDLHEPDGFFGYFDKLYILCSGEEH